MPTAEFQEEPFDAEADYRLTLQTIEDAFKNNAKEIVQTGYTEVLAGVMPAFENLGASEKAEILKIVWIRAKGGYRTGYDVVYGFSIHHLDADGKEVPPPYMGSYRPDFSVEHVLKHTRWDGIWVRSCTEAARYDRLESTLAAPSAAGHEIAAALNPKANRSWEANREAWRQRIEKWLGWLAPLSTFMPGRLEYHPPTSSPEASIATIREAIAACRQLLPQGEAAQAAEILEQAIAGFDALGAESDNEIMSHVQATLEQAKALLRIAKGQLGSADDDLGKYDKDM